MGDYISYLPLLHRLRSWPSTPAVPGRPQQAMLEMGFCWGEAEPGEPGNLRRLPSIYIICIYIYRYIYIHKMVHVYNSRVYSY